MKNNRENENTLEALFEALKKLSAENAASVKVVDISGQSVDLNDLMSKITGKNNDPEPETEEEEFLNFLRSLSEEDDDYEEDYEDDEEEELPFHIRQKYDEAKRRLDGMTETEKAELLAVSIIGNTQEMDVDTDLVICELLSMLSANRYSQKIHRAGGNPLSQTAAKNVKSLFEAFRNGRLNAGFTNTEVHKAVEMGEQIYEMIRKPSTRLSREDIVIALSVALNNAIREK